MIDEAYIRESFTGALLLAEEVDSEISVYISGIGEFVIDKSVVKIMDHSGNSRNLTKSNMEGRIIELIQKGVTIYDN